MNYLLVFKRHLTLRRALCSLAILSLLATVCIFRQHQAEAANFVNPAPGGGAVAEDKIFDWKITGHYRYF